MQAHQTEATARHILQLLEQSVMKRSLSHHFRWFQTSLMAMQKPVRHGRSMEVTKGAQHSPKLKQDGHRRIRQVEAPRNSRTNPKLVQR